MKNSSLIKNYIDKYEKETENDNNPISKYLDNGMYESESFSSNSFSKMVLSELPDVRIYLNLLETKNSNLKSEIIELINTNYNNYVVLLAKLQNIDFLIENIQLPLKQAKYKTDSEIELIKSYSNEISDLESEYNKIFLEVYYINTSLLLNSQYDDIILSYKNIMNGGITLNRKDSFFDISPENLIAKVNLIYGNEYRLFRLCLNSLYYIVLIIKKFNFFYNLLKKIENQAKKIDFSSKNQKFFIEESEKIQIEERKSEVLQKEKSVFMFLEKVMSVSILEYKGLMNNIINSSLLTQKENQKKNQIFYIFKNILHMYHVLDYKNDLYIKIHDYGVNSILLTYLQQQDISFSNKIIKIKNDYEKYFSFLQDISNRENLTYNFNLNCLLFDFMNKLNSNSIYIDKSLLNCSDVNSFNDSYTCFINFIYNSLTSSSLESLTDQQISIFHEITNQLGFVTYFQLLQNELLKKLIDDYSKENTFLDSLISEGNSLGKSKVQILDEINIPFNQFILNSVNFLYIINSLLTDLFGNKKIFIKVYYNIITFLLNITKYTFQRISFFINHASVSLLLDLIQSSTFSFEEKGMKSIKEMILRLVINLNTFKKLLIEDLIKNIEVMISREGYLLRENEKKELVDSRIEIKDMFKSVVDVFYEENHGFFIRIYECNEIKKELLVEN